jgi:hypothetical protein
MAIEEAKRADPFGLTISMNSSGKCSRSFVVKWRIIRYQFKWASTQVATNQVQLRQVFVNLIMNAVDAMSNVKRSDWRRQASRRPRKSARKRRDVVTGVSLCAARPLELPYATSSGGKPSSLVVKFFIYLVSAGNNTRDSKQQLHFRQYQIWQARLSLQYSDLSGATSSLLHWTHFIPKLERPLDALVLIIASVFLSRSAKT